MSKNYKLFFLLILFNLITFNLSAIPKDFYPNFYSDYVNELNVSAYLGEGYEELQGRLYSIYAHGSRYESIDSVMETVLYKAAMATYENGFTYFTIISNDISEKYFGNTSTYGYVNSYGGVSVYGGDAIYRNTGNVIIFVFDDFEELKVEKGEKVSYYKALNIYTPLTNEQLEKMKIYNQSFVTSIGTGLTFKENEHPSIRVGLEYNHLFNSFSIGGNYIFSFQSIDHPEKSEYSDYIYKNTETIMMNSLGIPLKYYFIKPQENKNFYLNIGLRPDLIINNLFSSDNKVEVGYGIEPNIELGFYSSHFTDNEQLGLNVHIGYNINSINNYLNITCGFDIVMK